MTYLLSRIHDDRGGHLNVALDDVDWHKNDGDVKHKQDQYSLTFFSHH